MARKLKKSVAVITGASSGIGRATALALSKKGATVVVAARRSDALRDLVSEIERGGGRALAVPTDVTDEQAVQNLAAMAVQHFERIDIWVNNAAVMSFGRFADTPTDVIRRVMDTNFFGTVHGARAALPVFRNQGHGTLINVASVAGRAPQPHAAAYVASKHAVRSLSMNLRQELMMDDMDDVHVVTILPATVDTPLFHHVANYTGKEIKAPPPVYPAEDVADAIIEGVRSPEPEIFVGSAAQGANIFMKLMPGQTERVATGMVKMQEAQGTYAPPTTGNLFTPSDVEPTVSGGWRSNGSSRMRKLSMAGLAVAAIPVGRSALNRLKK